MNSNAIAPPIAPSNLTRISDLAAAAYMVNATEPVLWQDLPEPDRVRWIQTTAYLLDIVLEQGAHDDSERVERLRRDAVGARNIAEIQMRKAIDFKDDMARITAEVQARKA
jgi:hypothetical protein